MNLSPQQTAEAYWLLYQTLPDEVQEEVKQRITRLTKSNKTHVDFRQLATKGWGSENRTYKRDELYD